jgi:hypothetical protein
VGRKKLPYSDGDWIAVPLRGESGFGVGLVAAHDGRGCAIGYFFDAKFSAVPSLADVAGLDRGDVLRVVRFGDLGILRRQWVVIGRRSDWSSRRWPIPDFCRRDITGRAFRAVYSADDLRGPAREVPVSDAKCNQLPRDALSGHGAVERILTHLLSDK